MAINTINAQVSFASLQGLFISQLYNSQALPGIQSGLLSPLSLASSGLSVSNNARQFQVGLANALLSLFNSAQDLKTASTPLVQTNAVNTLKDRSVSSSNATVVTGTAQQDATLASYTFTVSQLAREQINLGTQRTTTAITGLSAGTKNVDVTVGGTTTPISVSIAAGMTELQVLQALADAINNNSTLAASLTASVVTDATPGTSQIRIAADQTGTATAFSLSSTGGAGSNIVTYTGADTVSQSAQNAIFTVDGTAYNQYSNNVVLDSGKVTATLAGTSASNVTLTVAADVEQITSDLDDLVSRFNDFVNTLAVNAAYLTPNLARQVNTTLSTVRNDLSRIGISINASGTLSVDDDELEEAIEDNFSTVRNALGGANGIATRMEALADDVVSSPIGNFGAQLPAYNPFLAVSGYIQAYTANAYLSLLASGGLINALA